MAPGRAVDPVSDRVGRVGVRQPDPQRGPALRDARRQPHHRPPRARQSRRPRGSCAASTAAARSCARARLVAGARALTSFSEEMTALGLSVEHPGARRPTGRRHRAPRRGARDPGRRRRWCGCDASLRRPAADRHPDRAPAGRPRARSHRRRPGEALALRPCCASATASQPAWAEEVYRVAGAGSRDADLLGIARRSRRPSWSSASQRRARTLRVHALDHARRPLRDPLDALRHVTAHPSVITSKEHSWPTSTSAALSPSPSGRAPTTTRASTRIAERFADTLAAGGLVHLYGSGHSVLPCQETFPRYGSYVGFNPLTDPARDVAQRPRRRRCARAAVARAHREIRRQVPRPPAAQRGRLPRHLRPLRAATLPASRPRSTPRSAVCTSSRSPCGQPREAGDAFLRQAARRRRRHRSSTPAHRSRTRSCRSRAGAARSPARRRCWR